MNEKLQKILLNKLSSFIEDIPEEKVVKFIQKDVDLADIVLNKYAMFLGLIRTFKESYRDELLSIKYDNVLTFIKERRPELYEKIIKTPNGKSWVKKNIKNLKEILL